ncbi:hypothetical protein [uncultured Ruegeria sp.]|uniref:hypothetical protein n=1 Tax=uncultured Ruegeria sp. TaxID=259304 RepID=UPI0026182F63|nr:hypothetical protein [uncultured Ruegeria sp.]
MRAPPGHFPGLRSQDLAFSVPPSYCCSAPIRWSKVDGFTGIIDHWLSDNQQWPCNPTSRWTIPNFGWLKAQEITVAAIPLIATRLSFSGELAWELYASSDLLGGL